MATAHRALGNWHILEAETGNAEKHYFASVAACDKVLAHTNGHILANLEKAETLLRFGQLKVRVDAVKEAKIIFEQAVLLCETVIGTIPSHRRALYLKGNLLLNLGIMLDEAGEDLPALASFQSADEAINVLLLADDHMRDYFAHRANAMKAMILVRLAVSQYLRDASYKFAKATERATNFDAELYSMWNVKTENAIRRLTTIQASQ